MSDSTSDPPGRWQPGRVLEELEFIYLPSADVASELQRYVDQLRAIIGRRDF